MDSAVKISFTNCEIKYTKCKLLFKIKSINKREAEESHASRLHSFPRKQQRRYVEVYVYMKILIRNIHIFQDSKTKKRCKIVTVQPSASLLRNLLIPNRLRRGADSFLAKLTCSYGLCSKCKAGLKKVRDKIENFQSKVCVCASFTNLSCTIKLCRNRVTNKKY